LNDIAGDINYSSMSKPDKYLAQMRQNPRDWRIEQLITVARAHGITHHQPGTSHVTFRRADGGKLTVPARRPIKPFYVQMFVRLIDGENGQ
jgi:hypothetical protein